MPSFIAGLIVGFFCTAVLLILLLIAPNPTSTLKTPVWYGLLPCSYCKGSGRTKSGNQPCEACKGKRLVLVYLDPDGKPVKCFKSDLSCGICGGTGWKGVVKTEEKENLCRENRQVLINCPECGGDGKLEYGYDIGYSNNPSMMYTECHICKGSGWILQLEEGGKKT